MKNLKASLSRPCLLTALAVIFSLLVAGCATTGKPQYSVENYLLDYPAPSSDNSPPLAASVKFNRFSIAAVYNTVNMIFRSDAYSIDAFNYSRWAVNPADMVADDLLRDMRSSRHLQAVFSRYDADEGRFILSGGVEEFYLKTNGDSKSAVIGLVISLQDATEISKEKKLLFQKKFSQEQTLEESSPRGFARAASLSMQALSRQITADIYSVIKKRVQ